VESAQTLLIIQWIAAHKQGLFLPGTHIPILPARYMKRSWTPADFALEPQREIMAQMAFILEWGGKFVGANPSAKIFRTYYAKFSF